MRASLPCTPLPPLRSLPTTSERSYRKRAHDVFLQILAVAGSQNALALIAESVSVEIKSYQVSGHREWRALESWFHVLRSIARKAEQNESLMPFLIQQLLAATDPHPIRYTSLVVLGRYSNWIARHPPFLDPVLKCVVAGLGERGDVSSPCPLRASIRTVLGAHACTNRYSPPRLLHSATSASMPRRSSRSRPL
jgi:hypothetical protein